MSRVSQHLMRYVRLFQQFDLAVCQSNFQRGQGLIELKHLRRADDGRGDAGLVEQPGQRDLRRQ